MSAFCYVLVILQAIETNFAHGGQKDGSSEWLAVEFQGGDNKISLDIQKGGQVLESGWKITPMFDPGVSILVVCTKLY